MLHFSYTRKQFLKMLLIGFSLFMLLIALGCGGGVSQSLTADQSKAFVDQLATLSSQANQKQISDDQFIQQLSNLVTAIDSTPNGVQLLQKYLETNVSGRTIPFSAIATTSARDTTQDQSLLNKIKSSTAYQMLQAFLTTVIFSQVPDPAGTLIQAANPQLFITLSEVQVRTHILDAEFSSRITVDKAAELLNLNGTNPYEAERQLLTAQGQPIPAWLQPAPSCISNCPTPASIYNGTFSGNGQFSRQFPQTTCTWNITFTGTAALNLTAQSNNSVSGSVHVFGTATVVVVSGSTTNFTCLTDPIPFDDTQSISGTASNISWITNLSGNGGPFTGTFQGQLQNPKVTGDIAVSYSLGTGSATLSISLTKQ